MATGEGHRAAVVLNEVVPSIDQVYLNGDFVALERATVSVLDRGFLFGDGVYEVIPSYGGYFLGLEPHLDRLDDSLSAIRLENPLTRGQWRQILRRLIGPPPAAKPIRLSSGHPGCAPGAGPPVSFGCHAHRVRNGAAYQTPCPRGWDRGDHLCHSPDPRWSRCEIKAISLLAADVLMRREAQDEDALETIMIRDGLVTEGSSTNVFMMSGDTIATPAKGHLILSGITRELALSLARTAGMRFTEGPVPAEALGGADGSGFQAPPARSYRSPGWTESPWGRALRGRCGGAWTRSIRTIRCGCGPGPPEGPWMPVS